MYFLLTYTYTYTCIYVFKQLARVQEQCTSQVSLLMEYANGVNHEGKSNKTDTEIRLNIITNQNHFLNKNKN